MTTQPPSRAKVKERVELYLYSPSGSLWPVLGRKLIYSSYLGSASHSCSLLRPCCKIFTHKNVLTEVFRDVTLCVTGYYVAFQRIVTFSFG
jgi:hypothetical protein